MGISRFLRSRLATGAITPAALAKGVGVHANYIYRWLQGRGFPNERQLQMLSKYFSATVDEILQMPEARSVSEGKLPILATVDCGLFNPAVLVSDEDVEWVAVPAPLLCHGPRTNQAKGDAFVLRPHGDSMQPLIRDRSLLVLRTPHRERGRLETPEPESIVAAAYDLDENPPEAAIKVLRYSSDRQTVILESLNKKYPPIARRADKIRIEGIVTAIIDPDGIRAPSP